MEQDDDDPSPDANRKLVYELLGIPYQSTPPWDEIRYPGCTTALDFLVAEEEEREEWIKDLTKSFSPMFSRIIDEMEMSRRKCRTPLPVPPKAKPMKRANRVLQDQRPRKNNNLGNNYRKPHR
jgi:hypothetical protein